MTMKGAAICILFFLASASSFSQCRDCPPVEGSRAERTTCEFQHTDIRLQCIAPLTPLFGVDASTCVDTLNPLNLNSVIAGIDAAICAYESLLDSAVLAQGLVLSGLGQGFQHTDSLLALVLAAGYDSIMAVDNIITVSGAAPVFSVSIDAGAIDSALSYQGEWCYGSATETASGGLQAAIEVVCDPDFVPIDPLLPSTCIKGLPCDTPGYDIEVHGYYPDPLNPKSPYVLPKSQTAQIHNMAHGFAFSLSLASDDSRVLIRATPSAPPGFSGMDDVRVEEVIYKYKVKDKHHRVLPGRSGVFYGNSDLSGSEALVSARYGEEGARFVEVTMEVRLSNGKDISGIPAARYGQTVARAVRSDKKQYAIPRPQTYRPPNNGWYTTPPADGFWQTDSTTWKSTP